jgi:hypothetical protein
LYKTEFAEFRAYTTQRVPEQGKWEYFHDFYQWEQFPNLLPKKKKQFIVLLGQNYIYHHYGQCLYPQSNLYWQALENHEPINWRSLMLQWKYSWCSIFIPDWLS